MALLLDILSWCFILPGCGFLLIGAIGVLRMPDFYTRLHAAGLTDTMGASLLTIGMLLQAGFSMAGLKLVLMLLFVIFTSPIAAHALINAAYTSKLGMGRIEDRTVDWGKGDQS